MHYKLARHPPLQQADVPVAQLTRSFFHSPKIVEKKYSAMR
jgi:hypothetical protein